MASQVVLVSSTGVGERVPDVGTRPVPGLADDVRRILLRAVQRVPTMNGIGCLLMDGAGALRYVSATDGPGAMLELAEELSLEGPCHEAFVLGDTLVHDVKSDPRWPRLGSILGATPINAVVGVPIMLEGAPIGALDAYTDARVQWGAPELAVLRPCAHEIGALLSGALAAASVDGHGDDLTDQVRAALGNRATLTEAARVVGEDAELSEAAAALRIRQIAAVTGTSALAVAKGIVARGRLPELGEVSMLHEAERHHREQMTRLAVTDPLTGLSNRFRLLDQLEQALARTDRSGHAPALAFIDLDRFKIINDSMGHEVGDQVLCAVAGRLREAMRLHDTVARIGGDEFAVLCEAMDEDVDVDAVGRRILGALTDPVIVSVQTPDGEIQDQPLFIQASVGITVPDASMRPTEVLRDADMAMYDAKRNGGAVTVSTIPLLQSAARAVTLGQALRGALDGPAPDSPGVALPPGFSLVYQPLVTLDGGLITTLEALVRWRHPQLGTVPAEELVGLAEQVGLIVPLGAAILRQACMDAQSWQERVTGGDGSITVAVNVAAPQLAHPGFYQMVLQTLQSTGLCPQSLCLEITETEILQGASGALATMARLTEEGVRLTLDDFGTGYSSLSYLTRLPIHQLKIDQSFVAGVDFEPRDRAVAQSIISLGDTLDLRTVAEGVETRGQEGVLTDMGCDLAQGYLYSHPVPADEVPQLIAARGLSPALSRKPGCPGTPTSPPVSR